MFLSVSSYSFHRMVENGACREIDLIPLARDLGFDGIEFAELHPDAGVDKAVYAARLREESEKCGLPIVAYAVGANLAQTEPDALECEVERLCGEVDTAALLGCRLMRHDAASGVADGDKSHIGFDGVLPALISGSRAVTEYAREKGVRTMTENHGFFCQESRRLERLVTGVHSENYGLLLDMGNFLCVDEDPTEAFGRLVDFAFHVHVKDFHKKSGECFVPPSGFFRTRGGNFLRGAIVGHGDVPVCQCLRLLRAHGYQGMLTLEFEGMEEETDGVRLGREYLRRMDALLDAQEESCR